MDETADCHAAEREKIQAPGPSSVCRAVNQSLYRWKDGSMNQHKPYGPYERWCKRPLDFLIALLALLLLSPLFLLLTLLVRFRLGSPVFFTQERPGRQEKIFRLCKFRTMTDARDERGAAAGWGAADKIWRLSARNVPG